MTQGWFISVSWEAFLLFVIAILLVAILVSVSNIDRRLRELVSKMK